MNDDDALVEAVARAICKIQGRLRWDHHPDSQMMRTYGDVARAALSATPLARYRDALEEIATEITADGFTGRTIPALTGTQAMEVARKALEGE